MSIGILLTQIPNFLQNFTSLFYFSICLKNIYFSYNNEDSVLIRVLVSAVYGNFKCASHVFQLNLPWIIYRYYSKKNRKGIKVPAAFRIQIYWIFHVSWLFSMI